MTNSILFLAVLATLVVVNVANNSQKFIGNAVNEAYPGDCYYKDEDVPIKVGAKYISKKACEELECRSDFVLQFSTCPGTVSVGGRCTMTEDKKAPFPKCCPVYKCPE